MRKILTIAAALAALSAAPAFASEGTYAPLAVASPASGPAVDRGTGNSFVFATPSGSYGDAATPAQGSRFVLDRGTVRLGSFQFNMGSSAS